MALKFKKKDIEIQVKKVEVFRGGAENDESNWLVSYADMMTLLCGFFIMMFSMAKLDDNKYDTFKEAVSKAFHGEYDSPTKDMARYATQFLQENGLAQDAVIKFDATGVAMVFQSQVFFDDMSSDISPRGKIIIQKVIDMTAERQQKTNKQYRIIVEGHSDSRPIVSGLYPSNWELSAARAARVVRMFLDRGFVGDHLTPIGYSDTQPVAEARLKDGTWDNEALKKNRRVILRIMEPKVDSIPFPNDKDLKTLESDAARKPAASAPVAPAAAATAPVVPAAAVTADSVAAAAAALALPRK
ncbi:MAG: OmpA/MotB family protein [Bdellovibrionota bacterium]